MNECLIYGIQLLVYINTKYNCINKFQLIIKRFIISERVMQRVTAITRGRTTACFSAIIKALEFLNPFGFYTILIICIIYHICNEKCLPRIIFFSEHSHLYTSSFAHWAAWNFWWAISTIAMLTKCAFFKNNKTVLTV